MYVNFDELDGDEKDAFVEGFIDADDIGVEDWETDCPYGCPWFWVGGYDFDSETPYDWGHEWFYVNREEILQMCGDTLPEDE